MSPTRYALGLFLLSLILSLVLQTEPAIIDAIVTDEDGPVANANVGQQGERQRAISDERGRVRVAPGKKRHPWIASKPGYRITSAAQPFALRLARLPVEDNADYAWIDPHPDPLQANNCSNCHGDIYREWKQSAHAISATNPKFLHLFAGTDGESPAQPTWNVQAEHPLGAGVCAKCHAPTLDSPTLDYDVRAVEGVAKSGVHCDYCHKVADAPTDKLGTRFGRDGLMLLRPAAGDSLTFGPLDDAVRAGESFASLLLYKESRYCASCHEGIVFGVHVYGTYSEWLDSPPGKQGKQCQHCHMAPTGRMTNIAPGKGGVERDPATLASHAFPVRNRLGASVKMQVETSIVPLGRQVNVEVIARHVGHRVPTGFVDRQLILVVEAFDAKNRPVAMLEGARLPTSTGKWTGLPGMLYAKQLFGEAERTPVPFWLPILRTEDTRLQPEQPNRRVFLFGAATTRVTAQLWYRRFWQQVADARGFTDNDLLIAEQTIDVHSPR